jgi:heat shock protein HtpX
MAVKPYGDPWGMTISALSIDHRSGRLQQNRNLFDTVVLTTVMTLITAVAAYLILGWPGLPLAILAVGGLALAATTLPSTYVMQLYRAQPMDRRNGRDVYLLSKELARRAGMRKAPTLYVIPSLTLNAFATGTSDKAAIAVTEGLLRKLSLREIAGVLAHELSHVRNNDLRLMALADAMTRVLQVLSWCSVLLLASYVPLYLAGRTRIPWVGLAVLYLAPTIGTLIQLSLSRTREFDADVDAVGLTGDPEGLAMALAAIDRGQGNVLEDLIFPNSRRVPDPSMLRTHPATLERLARLRNLRSPGGESPIALGAEQPRVSLVGVGPSAMRPRYRFPGLWF